MNIVTGRTAETAIEQAGLYRILGRVLRIPEKDVLSRSAELAERNKAVLDEGERLVGSFRWRGASGPDPAAEWRVAETTRYRYPNDFARWIRGHAATPGQDGAMNCWEALLYTAHRAGAIDEATLRSLHAEASAAARSAEGITDDPMAARSAYFKQISTFLGPGERTAYWLDPVAGTGRPGIPAGHVVFVDDLRHVMLSVGTRDSEGRQQVLSLGLDPPQTSASGATSDNVMQKTSIEEYLSAAGKPRARVESAVPSWLLRP